MKVTTNHVCYQFTEARDMVNMAYDLMTKYPEDKAARVLFKCLDQYSYEQPVESLADEAGKPFMDESAERLVLRSKLVGAKATQGFLAKYKDEVLDTVHGKIALREAYAVAEFIEKELEPHIKKAQ